MRLIIKRSYCPVCGKLVKTREQKSGTETIVVCTQCGRQLYSWNGIRWKSGPQEPAKESAAASSPGLPKSVQPPPNPPAPAASEARRPAARRKTS